MTKPIILVAFADTHPNSMSALCPPEGLKRHVGGLYLPSDMQLWLWEQWMAFWDGVAALKRTLDAPVWVMDVGDGADDNTHSKYGLISLHIVDIVELGVAIRQRVRDISDRYYMFRGTQAHTGAYGKIEELIAKDLKTYKCPELGTWTWWHGLIDVAGVPVDVQHHPKNRAYLPHTIGAAANREAAFITYHYAYRSKKPKLAFRAHVHHLEDSGHTHRVRVFYLPPWQLTTEYGRQLGFFHVEPPGGVVTVCQDGVYKPAVKLFPPPEEE